MQHDQNVNIAAAAATATSAAEVASAMPGVYTRSKAEIHNKVWTPDHHTRRGKTQDIEQE